MALINTISEVVGYQEAASLYEAFHQPSWRIVIVQNEHKEMIYPRVNVWEYD